MDYKNYSKKPKDELEAPMPEYGLSEERAESPEYTEANEGLREFVNRRVNQEMDSAALEAGMDPEAFKESLSRFEGGPMGSVGNVAKMVAPALRGSSTADILKQVAEMPKSRFGRIINIVKEPSKFKAEKIEPVGKVFKPRK
jgi:hypothetical protein